MWKEYAKSSERPKHIPHNPWEVYDDYEGIKGQESYRGDLSLMYFAELDAQSNKLKKLEMFPMQMKRFQLHYASAEDIKWMFETLSRESAAFGTKIKQSKNSLFIATPNKGG